jgi:Na+-translocating ferredoxin:NAD+ oxidoreductase RnfG subunit
MVVLDPRMKTILGVRVIASKETPGFGERMNDALAPNSLAGLVTGRADKSRVVLKSRGTEVGAVQKQPDGSLVVLGASGEKTAIPAKDIAAVTDAPFPPAFVDQFTGLPLAEAKLVEDGGSIDALSGATITSRAVVGGVKAAEAAIRSAAGLQ